MFFGSASEETVPIQKLLEDTRSKPDEFQNISVRRFTHVKNLASYVLHEYLHVILEDNATGEWTQAIVERQLVNSCWGKLVIR